MALGIGLNQRENLKGTLRCLNLLNGFIKRLHKIRTAFILFLVHIYGVKC